MDDKAGRQMKPKMHGRRYKRIARYRREAREFLQQHRSTVFTGALLVLFIGLLLGLASQVSLPAMNAAPNGVTTVDYSTFVKQVQAGNVQAVAIQGDDVNALLKSPLVSDAAKKDRTIKNNKIVSEANDYATWSRTIGMGNTSSLTGGMNYAQINSGYAIYSHVPEGGKALLLSMLNASNVRINTLPVGKSSNIFSLLWHFAPIIFLVIALLIFFAARKKRDPMRSMDERFSQMGKSRARRFDGNRESTPLQKVPTPLSRAGAAGKPVKPATARIQSIPGITFADVAGIDEVRAELSEIVQFLRNPERFNRLGARIPRGALLVGQPGTGKTLLAKAVAGEANVPFFSMSASEFVEMFVGVGASRVRDLFNQARQVAPCVIFIDEIDAVGRKRSVRMSGNDERDQTLNQLLVELDGFDARQAVVVLAATNRVDILDQALLRPGRFDRRITVSLPDRVGREAILRVHTRATPLHEEVSLERLARLTTGMTGADLANLVNEAALSAARQDLASVTHECFEEALARVQLGALRPLVMSDEERRIIAIHEGGHALVAHHLPAADTVNRVTILPRGQSLGVTQFTAEADRYNYSRETLMARIAVGLGGRVAEELTFGLDHITTGAENDLQVVTDLARRMVTRWGMSEEVGVVFADYRPEEGYALNMRGIDPDTIPAYARALIADADGNVRLDAPSSLQRQTFAMSMSAPRSSTGVMLNALIDTEVQRILNTGRDMARALLTEHADQLILLADALIEHEQLDRAQFEALLKEQ
ncbi:MAG: ATP-dependent zinc metalloprotease FtsH [Ktedonobacteraceae bacterium]